MFYVPENYDSTGDGVRTNNGFDFFSPFVHKTRDSPWVIRGRSFLFCSRYGAVSWDNYNDDGHGTSFFHRLENSFSLALISKGSKEYLKVSKELIFCSKIQLTEIDTTKKLLLKKVKRRKKVIYIF